MLCLTIFLPLMEETIIPIETTNAAIRLFSMEPVSKAREKNSYMTFDWLHRFFLFFSSVRRMLPSIRFVQVCEEPF